jgi:hypothetical protein
VAAGGALNSYERTRWVTVIRPIPCEVRKGTVPRHERAVSNGAAPGEGGAS